ncbi:MAG: ribosome maturation factor RimP [Bacteroidota bacterium]
MEIIAQVKEWSEGFLPQELFLVDVELNEYSKKLSIYIDGDKGIDIDACKNLSRHLSEKLDAMDYGAEPYSLEVSSPGADRPLLVTRQYAKHIGRELDIKLKAETQLTGKLESANENGITILVKDIKKGYKDAPQKEIAFNDIDVASVILSFK